MEAASKISPVAGEPSLDGRDGPHSVPGAQVLQLVELLDHWHIDADELLAGSELTRPGLEEPHARVPVELWNRLVARARVLTGEPALGVFLGLRRRVSMYGFLGFATMSASTLREAFELAVQFSPVVTTAIKISLHSADGLATLRLEERWDPGECRDVAVFALVVGLGQIGKTLTGRDVPAELHLPISKPAYFDRFAGMFGTVRFDQPVLQLVFDAAHLDLPLSTPDRASLRLAREQCERALRDLGLDGGIVERVRGLIASPHGMLTLQQVATRLRMSVRTLKRRLAAQGVSFSELLDQERCQRACLLLRSSSLSLLDITERLGYSTLPNFARAFRRWTGQTPSAYRRGAARSESPAAAAEPTDDVQPV
ncbi:MAG: AraC family transcriptional regulator [Polyangiales bacterium]